MNDDFAIYVIGSRSRSIWLALRLDEEPWQSPEERRQSLLLHLSAAELQAWHKYQESEEVRSSMYSPLVIHFIDAEGESTEVSTALIPSVEVPVMQPAGEQTDESYGLLMEALSEEHRTELQSIFQDQANRELSDGPRFDIALIQRYIIWRVFELGWTIDRFGAFDRFEIGNHGRGAAKPERMGKKYQWIAYHEISRIPLRQLSVSGEV